MDAKCKYFGRCGGCTLQHVPYDAQVEQKRMRVESLLRRVGVGCPVDILSGSPFGYRNRMDFIFHEKGLGLRKRNDWKTIIDIEDCPIANDQVNELLKDVRSWFVKESPNIFDIRRQSGCLKYAVIRSSLFRKSASVSFVMNEEFVRLQEERDRIRSFAGSPSAENVVLAFVGKKSDVSISERYEVLKGSSFLEEDVRGCVLKHSIQGFFQNNPAMAKEMVDHVYRLFENHERKGISLLDLFGGVGTFGVCLSPLFEEVLIVESFEESVQLAEENLKENKRIGKAICFDAEKIGRMQIPEKIFALVDPPRSGMPRKTLDWLVEKRPQVLVYVSCNPEQLAKELPLLLKVFRVESVKVFDLFPQTEHCEVVVECLRR
jgi:23S rRNA (uracil-5-)-methyltransferase RumA